MMTVNNALDTLFIILKITSTIDLNKMSNTLTKFIFFYHFEARVKNNSKKT